MARILIERLDACDRELFLRWSGLEGASYKAQTFWKSVTRLGGVSFSVVAAVAPLPVRGTFGTAAREALVTLVVSHLIVQLIKRMVGRPRPSCAVACRALAEEPDKFSFPSGHSAAAMSVAFVYAMTFPSLAIVLIPVAMLVGASRIVLGVHYPGDVLIGQLVAVLTALPSVLR